MTTAAPCPAPPALAGLGSHGSRSTARTLLLALTLLLAAAFAGLAPAGARAEDFVAPSALGAAAGKLSENPYLWASRAPHIVSAPDGTSYATWVAPDGAGFSAVLATRPPGGDWATTTIAPAVNVSGGVPLGIQSNGTLTALIVSPTTNVLTAWTRPRGGTFGSPVAVSVAGRIAWPTLAVNASGEAVAGYRTSSDNGATWASMVAHRSSAGMWDDRRAFGLSGWTSGTAQLPTPTFAAGTQGGAVAWADIDPVTVAINDAGVYAIGMSLPTTQTAGTMRALLFVSTGVAGSYSDKLLTNTTLTPHHASRVQVAVSPSGAIGATWLQAFLNASPYEANYPWLYTATPELAQETGGPLSVAQTSQAVPIVFSGNSRFAIAWNQASATLFGRVFEAAGSAGSTSIDGPTLMSPSADGVWSPALAADSAGRRVLTWANVAGLTVQARLSPAGDSAFKDIRSVAAVGSGVPAGPQAAFDDEGNAAFTWLRSTNAAGAAQGSGLDTVAPKLDAVIIPSSGIATTPLAFSAAATDRWSKPKLTWSFGDGASGDGEQASHAYGSANSYTAAVTATDSVGNATSSNATVAITAKPVPVAAPVDADGDGVFSDRDCNDEDARVKPTAHDVPGNKVDENCDGRDAAYGVLATTVGIDYAQLRDRLQLSGLVVRGVRVGDRIKVRCAGDGCTRKPNVERRVKKVTTKAEYTLLDLVKGLRLRPGAKLTVAVSREEFTTRIWTLTVRKGKKPAQAITCQLPGTKTTVACS